MEVLAIAVALLFFLAGIVGTILPMLPGIPLIFIGMLVYGYMTGFATLDLSFFMVQGIATALTFIVDYVATAVGTRKYGGSRQAAVGAVLGTMLGAVTLGPLGLVVGCFFGAMAGELLRGKPPEQAVRAGVGSLVGFLGAVVSKLAIAALMIAWFFVRIF
jgi:uncharacterized protein YqgC (DUF456 family)